MTHGGKAHIFNGSFYYINILSDSLDDVIEQFNGKK